MIRRRITFFAAALILGLAAILTGCGDQPKHSGGDEVASDQQALEAITMALGTMFTWNTATDRSSGDAYERSKQYLSDTLAAQGGIPERGPGTQWEGWAAANATVSAKTLIVAVEHAPDSPDKIEREVEIIQTVAAPGKPVLDTMYLTAKVTALRTPDGWRLDAVEVL